MKRTHRSAVSQAELDTLAAALRHTWYTLARSASGECLEGVQRQGFWVLGALMAGPRRMSDLSEATEISSASLTDVVDRLEERGLVARVRSAEDRRVVTAELTEEGRAVMLAAHQQFSQRLDQMLEPLTSDERHQLVALLTKMNVQRG